MVLEERPCEIVEPRISLLAAIFLGVLSRGSLLDDVLTPAVETRLSRAKSGATEALVALFSIWDEHLDRFSVHQLRLRSPGPKK